jgi:hypothetical protein
VNVAVAYVVASGEELMQKKVFGGRKGEGERKQRGRGRGAMQLRIHICAIAIKGTFFYGVSPQ